MNNEILEYYLNDMGKYCLLTQEEETRVSVSVDTALDEYVDTILNLPQTWTAIIKKWHGLKAELKSPTKLA